MENDIKDLNKYIARIKKDQKILGSGVLWRPKSCEHNHIYVFTAAHVIKDCKNVEIEFFRNGNIVKVQAKDDSIKISKKYINKGDFYDVGIIVLDYTYDNLPSYKFATFKNGLSSIYKDKNLIMIGFPKEGHIEESYELSKDQLNLKYICVDNEILTFKYKISSNEIDTADRNSEMEGFSGAGVFCDLGSEIVLLGIHKGAFGSNAARGNLLGTTSDFIINMCSENCYDIPITINEINGNLSDQLDYFQDEIFSDLKLEDQEKVSYLLDNIIKQDITDVINSSFYNFCKECHYGTNYHQCNNFRGFLLVLTVFLKAMNECVDLTIPEISITQNIPIYFLCTEGLGRKTQAQLKLSHFIYAINFQKNLHTLKDNSIIIWGSNQQPRDDQRKCIYSEYQNILGDISSISSSTLDITSIYKAPRPKAIIHIYEIIDILRSGDIQQLQKKFAKYIGDLEK